MISNHHLVGLKLTHCYMLVISHKAGEKNNPGSEIPGRQGFFVEEVGEAVSGLTRESRMLDKES